MVTMKQMKIVLFAINPGKKKKTLFFLNNYIKVQPAMVQVLKIALNAQI